MDPVSALRRIAFLLERENAPTYRVKAFRNAAAVAAEAGPEELALRAHTGRLRDLPGVGEVTALVIQEALEGKVPAYLADLEGEHGDMAARDDAVTALIAALKGDCHVHSDWSDGGSPVEEMAEAARELGREYIVLTDHSPRLTIARGLSAERLREQLDLVAAVNERMAPFRILTGIECDILLDGSLDQDPELLGQLDVVVGSVHSKLRMERDEMTARMLRAVMNPNLDILGHCTGRMVTGRGRPESEFDAALVFEACAKLGKAVEINSRPERLDPPAGLLQVALQAGCLFTIDSDAHAPGQLAWLPNGAEMAVASGISGERILNTKPAEGLVAWARGHGGG